MKPLAQVLDETLRRLNLTEAALEARALMLWPQVVGPQVARASEARQVRAGTLLVTARSSAWNQELTFQKGPILRRYRERLGSDFVKDLRVSVGSVRGAAVSPAAQAPPEEEVRRIRLPAAEAARIREAAACGDPELSQAIRRALTLEAQARRWHLEHGARECPRCGAPHREPRELCPACRCDGRSR